MNLREMKRLIKSNPKLVKYCIERILSDDDTAKILREINRNVREKEKNENNSEQ